MMDDASPSPSALTSRLRKSKLLEKAAGFSKSEVATKLRRIDVFPKAQTTVSEKSTLGASATLFTIVLVLFLFVSETISFFTPNVHDELRVDTSFGGAPLRMDFNITFPSISCPALSLDILDVTGEQQIAIEDHIYKVALSDSGAVFEPERQRLAELSSMQKGTSDNADCGSCYGAEENPQDCCSTCDEVRIKYRKKNWAMPPLNGVKQCAAEVAARARGCNIHGFLSLKRVSGNFHFAPGTSFEHHSGGVARHVHNFDFGEASAFNATHIIHELVFSAPDAVEDELLPNAPGAAARRTLAGTGKTVEAGSASIKYFIKVVPSEVRDHRGRTRLSYLYSVTEHEMFFDLNRRQILPGVYFIFDISPLRLHVDISYTPFFHYFVRLCAIMGGIFLLSGWFFRLGAWLYKHGMLLFAEYQQRSSR